MSSPAVHRVAAKLPPSSGVEPGAGSRAPQDSGAPLDAAFFERYHWTLNPLLSVKQILQRLGEEADRYSSIEVPWQREEALINLYLFVCAAACTTDDYIGRRRWDLAAVAKRFPLLLQFVGVFEQLLNSCWRIPGWIRDRQVVRWRQDWTPCIEKICEVLVGGGGLRAEQWAGLNEELKRLAAVSLPEPLLNSRMRVPEAYRCQDMTHLDVISLARRFAESNESRGPVAMIGIRSAGAYFAPLVKAYLSATGSRSVAWTTIRPKLGLSGQEKRRLRSLLREDTEVLLVDDHPNTGSTLRLSLEILRGFGVRPERVAAIVPSHPAQPAWTIPGIRLYTVAPSEFYKGSMLKDDSLTSVLSELCPDARSLEVRDSPAAETLNKRFAEHYRDGFHVRLKRLAEIRLVPHEGPPQTKYIFAKSVGWGWLGYHAYIAGASLAGFVPRIVGLRNGILFTEWAGTPGQADPLNEVTPPVLDLAAYVARRVDSLPLEEDPCIENLDRRSCGWMELTRGLRRIYGPYFGRLKQPVLYEFLKSDASPVPTLVDGKMGPGEWIRSGHGFLKADFEHHNFGGGELNIVDPAYDLASAIFEFRLPRQDEDALLRAYRNATGDHRVSSRVWLYKMLYGMRAMTGAAYFMSRERSKDKQEQLNLKYLWARSFLTWQMVEYCGGLAGELQEADWHDRLFFLDLDGVLDREFMRFPHATPSGIAALELLKSSGFSVVLNTGRSVRDVWRYCRGYNLPGGIAEFGSVFVNAVSGEEAALWDGPVAGELERCREVIRNLPGVFMDPAYRYSVRAFRYSGEDWQGLGHDETTEILRRAGCRELRVIERSADTYFVHKDCDKGTAVAATVARVPRSQAVAGIGDSDHDIAMLSRVALPYAPANCSRKLRSEAGSLGCRIMSQRFQRGLLSAARDVVRKAGGAQLVKNGKPILSAGHDDLIAKLLGVAERSPARQLLGVLDFRNL
jgi:hypothetical protein